MIEPVRSTTGSGASPAPAIESEVPSIVAQAIQRNRSPVIDLAGLHRDLAQLVARNPQLSGAVDRALASQLSAREFGGYLRLAQAQAVAPPITAPANDTAPPAEPAPSTATLIADLTQMGLDLAGIVDPTPISDGSNALISVGRSIGALFGGNGREALGHLGNGALSAVGIIPYLGDAAKLGKFGKWADTVSNAIRAAGNSPAARSALEPALREARDLLAKIPQGALDSLPASAREAVERMKGQLDEFLSAGSRTADAVPSSTYTATVRGQRVVLNNVDAVPVNYLKRDRDTYLQLRREFDGGVRKDFLQHLATDPAQLAALRRAGLDDAAIERIASGRVPQGWQVHHKLPLDDGGTNAFDNLVLIKNDPYHIGLTNAQRQLVGDLEVGEARQIDFPVPRGSVYPPE